jgi:hypothetical protein
MNENLTGHSGGWSAAGIGTDYRASAAAIFSNSAKMSAWLAFKWHATLTFSSSFRIYSNSRVAG